MHLVKKGISLLTMLMIAFFMAGCAVKPQPLTSDKIAATVMEDRKLIDQGQEPIEGVLTLYEAMARAVAYNLDHRTRMMEEALAMGQMELAQFDMLPMLAANAGYSWRSQEDASYSRGYKDRTKSDRASFSNDPISLTTDLRFSWSLLDFGVSYCQAKQASDRYLIAINNRQKLVKRLMHQTRVAYTRAQAAGELRPKVRGILTDAKKTLEQLELLQKENIQSPINTLQSKRAIIELVGQLESLEQSLVRSEIELKSLVNVRPYQELILERPEGIDTLPTFEADLDKLELIALQNSLEISEEIYNSRIEQIETRKAMLRLFPDLTFGLGVKYDDSSYLVHNNWYQASTDVAWNLMRIASAGSIRKTGEIKENLTLTRRMALNMAVVSRLHTSWQQYHDTLNQVKRARQLDTLEMEIARHSKAGEAADTGSKIERIRNDASALRARMRRHETEAAAQDALGSFILSLGIDVTAKAHEKQLSLKEMTEMISFKMRQMEQGVLPVNLLDESQNISGELE